MLLGLLKILMNQLRIFLIHLLLNLLILRLIFLAYLKGYTRDQVRWTRLIPYLRCRRSCFIKSMIDLQAWVNILRKLWKTRALFLVLVIDRLAEIATKIYYGSFFRDLFLVQSVKIEIFMGQSFVRFDSLFRIFYKHLHYQILYNSRIQD